MHIAFLTPEYPHKNLKRSAGLGTSIKNLATGLIQAGVSVTVFVVFQQENRTFYDNNIKIVSISRKGYKFFGWYLERKHIQHCIQQEITSSNIDIIEAPDWTGITAFMKFSVPIVIRLHGTDAYFCNLEGRKQKRKNYFLEKTALKQANCIVSVSNFTANKTKEIFALKKPITTIYNGINTETFKPLEVPVAENAILYFGTIIRKKGVLELARAFNILIEEKPEATLQLLGKDVIDVFEKKSTLELFFNILSDKAKKQVIYLEEVHYSKVAEIISKSSLVTLPSFAEAFPMTWLEAMAMEKALVTSNIGWANELMIDEVNGFTINPKDHQKYASRMKILLDDSSLSIKFGINARKRVLDSFDTTLIVAKNISFFKNLIKQ